MCAKLIYSKSTLYVFSEEEIRNVLRKFSSNITQAILDPNMFAQSLYSKGLITGTTKRDIQTSGWTNSEKTMRLLDSMEAYLITTPKPRAAIEDFCKVLLQEPSTEPIVSKMEDYLGIHLI